MSLCVVKCVINDTIKMKAGSPAATNSFNIYCVFLDVADRSIRKITTSHGVKVEVDELLGYVLRNYEVLDQNLVIYKKTNGKSFILPIAGDDIRIIKENPEWFQNPIASIKDIFGYIRL